MSTGQSSADIASSWRREPGPASLSRSEVHVWRLSLDQPLDQPRDRVRTSCRTSLLALLARYSGSIPGQIRLATGPYGKPCIEPGAPGAEIEFNVSHSGKLALIAMAAGRRVGVDVEEIRTDVRFDDLARGFLTVEEQELLGGLEGPAKAQAFFSAWTRREALIKAVGGRIVRPDAPAAGPWHLQEVPAGEGYAAALCWEGDSARISFWEWETS
jgi:4'-phosphopantetheinyl transferase